MKPLSSVLHEAALFRTLMLLEAALFCTLLLLEAALRRTGPQRHKRQRDKVKPHSGYRAPSMLLFDSGGFGFGLGLGFGPKVAASAPRALTHTACYLITRAFLAHCQTQPKGL